MAGNRECHCSPETTASLKTYLIKVGWRRRGSRVLLQQELGRGSGRNAWPRFEVRQKQGL